MTDPRNNSVQVIMALFRFSDDPSRLGSFLRLTGLSPVVSNDANTWLEMTGSSGWISVHGTAATNNPKATAGTTDLVAVTADVAAAASTLEQIDGVTVDVWDEAFGRQASVALADRTIIINEKQEDLYGYQAHDGRPGPVDLAIHWYTEDIDSARNLLELFGYEPDQNGAVEGQRFTSTVEEAGPVYLFQRPGLDQHHLGLESTEGVDQVLDRLRRASFAPDEVAPGRLAVDDPDGQPVTITA